MLFTKNMQSAEELGGWTWIGDISGQHPSSKQGFRPKTLSICLLQLFHLVRCVPQALCVLKCNMALFFVHFDRIIAKRIFNLILFIHVIRSQTKAILGAINHLECFKSLIWTTVCSIIFTLLLCSTTFPDCNFHHCLSSLVLFKELNFLPIVSTFLRSARILVKGNICLFLFQGDGSGSLERNCSIF